MCGNAAASTLVGPVTVGTVITDGTERRDIVLVPHHAVAFYPNGGLRVVNVLEEHVRHDS
jgi:hypothetical protein